MVQTRTLVARVVMKLVHNRLVDDVRGVVAASGAMRKTDMAPVNVIRFSEGDELPDRDDPVPNFACVHAHELALCSNCTASLGSQDLRCGVSNDCLSGYKRLY